MRLLRLSVPAEELDDLLDELSDRDLSYTVTAGAGPQSDRSVVTVPVPADAVEHVLDDLTAAGYDRGQFTVSLDAEFANFRGVDEVQNRWEQTPNRIAPATMRSKAKALRSNSRSYIWMMVLSAVVATAGLLLRSPAIVVGSMVIAPIVSPMLTASVGAVRNDREMFLSSVHQQAYGLGVAVATASAFAYVARTLHVVPVRLAIEQMELISIRISPSVLALVVGLSAGAAGAYGLATTGQATIVGVMIAAALIPTAAAAGIGVAWWNSVVAIGALLLLVLTIIAVNVGATATLFYLDYRPDDVDTGIFDWSSARQAAIVIGTLLFVAAVVTTVGGGFLQQGSFERGVNDATTSVLNDEEYEALTVRSVSIEYDAPERFGTEEPTVTVEVIRTDDQAYPDLPDEFDRRITEETGREVMVQVQFVDFERSSGA